MELKEFTVDDCLRTMYETPSDGAKSNEGKVCIIPLENLIDFNEEIKRQQKKLDKLVAEKNSLSGRMANEKFVANAPKELIEQTKSRIEEIQTQENTIKDLIASLKA